MIDLLNDPKVSAAANLAKSRNLKFVNKTDQLGNGYSSLLAWVLGILVVGGIIALFYLFRPRDPASSFTHQEGKPAEERVTVPNTIPPAGRPGGSQREAH